MPLPLQGQRGDKALYLGCLAVLLAILLLYGPVRVDVLPHVIILAEIEKLSNLGCPLRTALARLLCVCQPRDLARTCDTLNTNTSVLWCMVQTRPCVDPILLQSMAPGNKAGWDGCCTVHAWQQHGWE